MSRIFSGFVWPVAIVVTLLTIALSFVPWLFPSEQSRRAIYADESGVFEEISLILWLALGVGLLLIVRPFSRHVLAGSIVAFAAGAREASWHKAFTDGESVLKIGFYLDSSFPLLERLGFAVVVLVCLVCIVTVGLALFTQLRAQGFLRPTWARLLLVFVVAMVVSKILDRMPNILDVSFGLPLPTLAEQMMQASEEGLEMLLPVILSLAAFSYARHRFEPATVKQADPAWQG